MLGYFEVYIVGPVFGVELAEYLVEEGELLHLIVGEVAGVDHLLLKKLSDVGVVNGLREIGQKSEEQVAFLQRGLVLDIYGIQLLDITKAVIMPEHNGLLHDIVDKSEHLLVMF